MSHFFGFKRKAVVIVPTEEDAEARKEKKIQEEGIGHSESAIITMKSNFIIPSIDDTFSEVEFPELALEEALKVIEKYRTEVNDDDFSRLIVPKRPSQTQTSYTENEQNEEQNNHSGTDNNRGPPLPTCETTLSRQELHIFPSITSKETAITEELDAGEETVHFSVEAIEAIHALKEGEQAEEIQDDVEIIDVDMETDELDETSEDKTDRGDKRQRNM